MNTKLVRDNRYPMYVLLAKRRAYIQKTSFIPTVHLVRQLNNCILRRKLDKAKKTWSAP